VLGSAYSFANSEHPWNESGFVRSHVPRGKSVWNLAALAARWCDGQSIGITGSQEGRCERGNEVQARIGNVEQIKEKKLAIVEEKVVGAANWGSEGWGRRHEELAEEDIDDVEGCVRGTLKAWIQPRRTFR